MSPLEVGGLVPKPLASGGHYRSGGGFPSAWQFFNTIIEY